MRLADYLLVVCGALDGVLGLMVTLSESDTTDNAFIILKDSPRSIPLVPTNTYVVSCDGTWERTGAELSSDVPAEGVSQVYTVVADNSMELKLQRFSSSQTGQYVCEDMNGAEFVLNITTGNPILIANRDVISLDKNKKMTRTIKVFGSGQPQPTMADYTWFFNNTTIFSNGTAVGEYADLVVNVEHNRIITEERTDERIGGVYVSQVRTSKGTVNVSIQVNIEVQTGAPTLSVLSPVNYDTEYLAIGESIILRCGETMSVPVATISWFLGDSQLEGDESDISITTSNGGRESNLTLSAVNQSLNGVVIKCVVSNVVEDVDRSKEDTRTLILRPPPRPPTNLTVQTVSSCVVQLSWIPPSDPPPSDNTLSAEYYLIEAQPGLDGDWVTVSERINATTTSNMIEVSLTNSTGMRNVTYSFRISSGNKRGGASPLTTQASDTVQLYYDDLLAASSVAVFPLSSPSASLHVTWSNSSSSTCYLFSSHTVFCNSTDNTSRNETRVEGGATSTVVTGLAVDTTYSCLVRSTVRDVVGGEFPMMTLSDVADGFTYPASPTAPPQPKPSNMRPSPTTITVEFFFADDHNTISHYQVLVVRLREETNLPAGDPDDLYPSNLVFSDESAVNDPKMSSPLKGPYIAAEISAQSFNRTFIIGSDVPSGPNSTYQNGPLLSGTKYSCFLRAFPVSTVLLARGRRQARAGEDREEARQYSVFSSSPFMAVQETSGDEESSGGSDDFQRLAPYVGSAGGVTVLLVVLIALLFIVMCVYRTKRRAKRFDLRSRSVSLSSSSKDSLNYPTTPDLCRKNQTSIELNTMEFSGMSVEEARKLVPSPAIPVSMFREHVEKFNKNRQLLFQYEYDWIQQKAPVSPSEASGLAVNDDKNRYSNIKAFDHSRVVLTEVKGVEGSDYINANFIPGYSRTQEYISTQGPLDQTVVNFWRMVWEQNTATIIMLANLVELGKVKCSQYWPSPNVGTVTHGDIEIQLDSVAELSDYTIRNFTVKHLQSNETHEVLHFHYTKWPDYGTPKLAAPLLNFLRAVHTSNPDDVGPIVVHCSAGVGRSGTVICIDYCLCQLKADHVVDVCGYVNKMREHRNYMVQTEEQYAFIHYAILEAITYGDTSFDLPEFHEAYQHLQQRNEETGETLLQEEYGRLGSVKTMAKSSTFIQRVKQKGPTNRSIHYPGHASYSEGRNPHEYNAHYIDAYFTPKLFVVADGPEKQNAAKFWQMVWDQDCAYLIMLTPVDAEHYSYWPGKGQRETFSNICVAVEEENAEHFYTTRVISVSNAKIGISQKLTQYQFEGWTTQKLPPVSKFVSFVCEVLKGVETLQKNQKALVHDMKSFGPSGIFCSLCFCIERIRVERIVDVFQAVQSMQLQRPGSVQSMQEYAFVYDCVYEYIRTHSTS